MASILNIIPIEAGASIVLWIGIVITAQAYQATPLKHAPAVAMGIFPAIAAWGVMIVEAGVLASGKTLYTLGLQPFQYTPLNSISK